MPSEKHQLSDAKIYITLLVQGDRFPTKNAGCDKKKRKDSNSKSCLRTHTAPRDADEKRREKFSSFSPWELMVHDVMLHALYIRTEKEKENINFVSCDTRHNTAALTSRKEEKFHFPGKTTLLPTAFISLCVLCTQYFQINTISG